VTGVRVTGGGMGEIERALKGAQDEAVKEAKKIVSKGALNVKKEWQRRWSDIAHAPMLPYTINYDMAVSGYTVSAEIGPDDRKVIGGGPHRTPGNLANLIEYGSVHNAPMPGGLPAVEHEAPNLERYAEELGVRLIEE